MYENDKEVMAVMERLERLGITAQAQGGDILLPEVCNKENGNRPIRLPAGEMETLVDKACAAGIRQLADGMFAAILIAQYNLDHMYR